MANEYDVGDAVRVSTSTAFTDSNSTAFDPDTITAKFKNPSGTTTPYVYGTDAERVKDATGDYHFDINVTAAGTWYYRIEGVTSGGDKRGADEGNFIASPTEF